MSAASGDASVSLPRLGTITRSEPSTSTPPLEEQVNANGVTDRAKQARGLASPQFLGRQLGAFREGFQLGPGDLWVHARAHAAVGAGNDVLASY